MGENDSAENQTEETRCPFCLIVEGKIKAEAVYADENFLGILDINPANPGHILLFPKKHFPTFGEMNNDLTSKMFLISKEISGILMKTLKAPGYNLLLANGVAAGQHIPHLLVHIIPRFNKDGVSFVWDPKPMQEADLKSIASAVKSSYVKPEKPKPKVFSSGWERERIA